MIHRSAGGFKFRVPISGFRPCVNRGEVIRFLLLNLDKGLGKNKCYKHRTGFCDGFKAS